MTSEQSSRWNNLVQYIREPERKRQFDNFVEYLKEHSAYFTAPASPGYHESRPGGLLNHSLNVAENALYLWKALPGTEKIDREELIICALFHDLGKAYIEEDQPYYLFNEPTASQKKYGYVAQKPFKYNDAGQVFMTVPQRSVRLITQFIDISDQAYMSVLTHDGQYVEENHPYACKECPMQLLLHYADSWAGFTMEGKSGVSEDGKSYTFLPPDDRVGVHGAEVRKSRTRD